MVAFNGLQLRLDGFNERPGKVGSCVHRTAIIARLVFQSGAESGLSPPCEARSLTSSHGQTIREVPSVVLTSMSKVPTSVTVPTRMPSRTWSPMRNCIVLPPRLPTRLYGVC
jgi:hypothetical protein